MLCWVVLFGAWPGKDLPTSQSTLEKTVGIDTGAALNRTVS